MLNIPTTEERLGKSPQRLLRYLLLFMAAIYVGVGVALWITANSPSPGGIIQLPPIARRVLGSVFIFYGLLRAWRGYQSHFRPQKPQDHD